MSKELQKGACRFCGQITTIDTGKNLTIEQADEQATISCTCPEAIMYRREKRRKERAIKHINELFGTSAPKRCSDTVLTILMAAVVSICNNDTEKISLSLRGELRQRYRKTARVI